MKKLEGIDSNTLSRDDITLLHKATERKRQESMKITLRYPNVNINIHDPDGNTPLHLAVTNTDGEALKILLQYKDIAVYKTG